MVGLGLRPGRKTDQPEAGPYPRMNRVIIFNSHFQFTVDTWKVMCKILFICMAIVEHFNQGFQA